MSAAAVVGAAAVSGRAAGLMGSIPDLQHAIQDICVDMQVMRGSIQHLTNVLQGTQERTAALEAASTAQAEKLDRIVDEQRVAKSRDDQNLLAIHAAKQDLTASGGRLRSAWERLDAQHERLATATAEVEGLRAANAALSERLARLEQQSVDTTSSLDKVTRQTEEHFAHLSRLSDATRELDILANEASGNTRHLSGAHDALSQRLSDLLESTLNPALEQAERERIRLDAAEGRVGSLEVRHAEHAERSLFLHGASEEQAAQLSELRELLSGHAVTAEDFSDWRLRSDAQHKADRERLDDAWRALEGLQTGAREASAAFLQMREDFAELRRGGSEQGALAAKLATGLEALRHDLEATDVMVDDLRTYLQLPYGAVA